jgi:uncharacterized protein
MHNREAAAFCLVKAVASPNDILKGGRNMNCPVCNVNLRISERRGIEIDYCPQCRGVWQCRGEPDKMIERSVSVMPGYACAQQPPYARDRHEGKHRGDRRDGHYGKRSILHDLFD